MVPEEYEEYLRKVHMKLKKRGIGAKERINKDVEIEYLGDSNFAVSIKGKTKVIDPPDSVSLDDPTEDGMIELYNGVTYTRRDPHDNIIIGPAVAANKDVFRGYVEWDVTTIPDGATITDTVFKFHCWYDRAGRVSGIFAMANRPSTSPDATVYADCGDGNQYVAYNGFVPSAGPNKSQDLGAAADADLQAALADNWFAIGMRMSNETPDGVSHKFEGLYSEDYPGVTPPPTLYVVYTPPAVPIVTTQDATDPCVGVGTLHGTITDVGVGNCDERGFEWGLDSGGPYPNSWTETDSYGVGAFSHTFTDFPEGTTIYYRAKAHNVAGWGYGGQKSFTTCLAPGTRQPSIELRLSDVEPPAADPPRTIYRDVLNLPDPVLLGITIRYYNHDDEGLYFKISAAGTGYTFTPVEMGLLGSGAAARRNLDEFGSRAKPGAGAFTAGEFQESIVLTLRAYTDAGYTNLKWTYQRTVTIAWIKSDDPAFTVDELDNFDDGTVQGWAFGSNDNRAGYPTFGVSTAYALSPVYSLRLSQGGLLGHHPEGWMFKEFTTPNKSKVFAVFNVRHQRGSTAYLKHNTFSQDATLLVYLGRPADSVTENYIPHSKWIQVVVPLPKNTTLTITHFLLYACLAAAGYVQTYFDDFKIISK